MLTSTPAEVSISLFLVLFSSWVKASWIKLSGVGVDIWVPVGVPKRVSDKVSYRDTFAINLKIVLEIAAQSSGAEYES